LLSDFYPHGAVADAFGVLRSDGTAERAIFVIDRQGIIRYVDVHDIGQQPDNEVLFEILNELAPAGARRIPANIPTPPATELKSDVVMYCTPWCSDCRKARAYLREYGIAYEEVDIARDRVAARRVREWARGNETTPTFDIRETIVVDFDKARLDELFERG
jgi:glutaredoxin